MSVVVKKPVYVTSSKPVVVRKKFDIRISRIMWEAEKLRDWGFKPVSQDGISEWAGKVRGYPVLIRFPSKFPAEPFEAYFWGRKPPGFLNILRETRIRGRRSYLICVEPLISISKWDPTITCDAFLESLSNRIRR